MSELTPDAALAFLLAQNPHGFTVSPNGQMTPAAGTKITSLDHLKELSCSPKQFRFDINGTEVEIEVRPLRDEEIAAIEKIGSEITPPPRFADRDKKVIANYDRNDPDYIRHFTKALEQRRAAQIALAVPALGVPPGTAEQQLEFLQKNLPSRVINALGAAVAALSTDTIERASFT